MKPSCQYCKDRYIGCHSRCGSYLFYRAHQDKANEARHKESEINAYEVPKLMANAIAKAAR